MVDILLHRGPTAFQCYTSMGADNRFCGALVNMGEWRALSRPLTKRNKYWLTLSHDVKLTNESDPRLIFLYFFDWGRIHPIRCEYGDRLLRCLMMPGPLSWMSGEMSWVFMVTCLYHTGIPYTAHTCCYALLFDLRINDFMKVVNASG